MQEKSISLYSDKGGADKVYNVFLVASGNDFKVNYQNGARGCTLTNGSKTTTPVPYDKAITIFDKLVKEKMTDSSKCVYLMELHLCPFWLHLSVRSSCNHSVIPA